MITQALPHDNGTFIVESFLDEPVDIGVSVAGQIAALHDLASGESLSLAAGAGDAPRFFGRRGMESSPTTTFRMQLRPHSCRAFACRQHPAQ
jgi:hypothetical protein